MRTQTGMPNSFQSPRHPFNLTSAQLWMIFKNRDTLANDIFPQLDELCSSRGTCVKAVDLRWSSLKAQAPLPSTLFRHHFVSTPNIWSSGLTMWTAAFPSSSARWVRHMGLSPWLFSFHVRKSHWLVKFIHSGTESLCCCKIWLSLRPGESQRQPDGVWDHPGSISKWVAISVF